MSRVVGIGGIFITAKDPAALREWYRRHLGMDIQEWGGMAFSWSRADGPGGDGSTTWSIFEEGSSHFAPSARRFMLNYVVKDLHAVLGALRAKRSCRRRVPHRYSMVLP
jgi:catechol 2,3-dioxygenase-like lactoylglutathione lyase family enzyme